MLKQISYYYVEDQRSVPAKAHDRRVSVALERLFTF